MASSISKSSSPTPKEQELESDRQIKRILRDDGMKKPAVVHVPDEGSNDYSLKLGHQKIGPKNVMLIDIATSSVYFLR